MAEKKKEDFLKTGLSSEEVPKLFKEFGPNELTQKQSFSNFKVLISQFESPLIYVLVFAGWVTIFLHDFTDAAVIFSAVMINAALGFWQERKAQKSLEAFRSLLMPQATVIRDGQQQVVEVREIVPGDLVILTIGTRIPADGVLLEATDLSVNEAILTGESIPVDKRDTQYAIGDKKAVKKENKAFMGTTVMTGIAKMLVTKTGMETEMGKIGKTLEEVEEEKTPLQIQLSKLARILAVVVGIVALLIFLLGGFLGYGLMAMFTTSVAVAVAAIPEGLVVTLTIILALGMQRILKRKALVRRLVAAETLGSVSVICADKTGTLTEGKMRVVEYLTEKPEVQETKELLVKAAILCNDLRDPLEVAMMDWALEGAQGKQEKLDQKKIQDQYPRLDEMPFSPETKIIATLHRNKFSAGQALLFVSGAPEVVLRQCKGQSAKCKVWEKKFDEYGGKGYRLVGFAYKRVHRAKSKVHSSDLKDLLWLGILVYKDPVREGVKLALKECQQAGIKIKVITGDYTSTALAVLKQLDLKLDPKTQVLEGKDLEKISKTELKRRVGNIILFTRTSPEQKLKIVEALKENGEVVAMMGDGVNDAPALKQADIGIVVGEASDVAKETADMVLLDSNFVTILHAVEEGRTIFENIKKVTLYLLSCSFTEIVLIGGSLVFRLPLPLTAGQILWINLVQDSLPAVALAFEPKEEGLMKDKPRKKEAAIIDLPMKVIIFIIGIITDFFLLGLVIAASKGILPFGFSQTMIFVSLGMTSSFIIFACRSLRKPIFKYNPFANGFLTGSILLGFIFLGIAVYFPPLQFLLKTHSLGAVDWFFLLAIGCFNLLAIEVTKWVFLIQRRKSLLSKG